MRSRLDCIINTVSLLTGFGLLTSFVVACGGGSADTPASPEGGSASASGGGGADATNGANAGDGGGSQQGMADVSVACGAWFDLAAAFRTRCVVTPLPFDTFPAVRPGVLAICDARAKQPGSGYTNAYYDGCRSVLEAAGCEDSPAIIKACWTPAGALSKGAPCAADHQCGEGFACETPLGSSQGTTCGTCQVPVFGQAYSVCGDSEDDTKGRVRCTPGTQCAPEGTGVDRCYSTIPVSPDAGAIVPVGSKCGGSSGPCEDGSRCGSPNGSSNYICQSLGVVGDACDYASHPCSNWLRCGGTKLCEIPENNLKCQ